LFGMFSNWMEGIFGLRVSCTILWILYCACVGSSRHILFDLLLLLITVVQGGLDDGVL
jgi:hypothetical protein